jgi:Lar family restriction alleviation protein
MSEPDLKPCPFCGGEASDGLDDDRECWYVECLKCRATFESKNSAQRAIVGWNNRVRQKSIRQLAKEYLESSDEAAVPMSESKTDE